MASDRDNRLGKYVLKSRLGKGGMGVVYLATDTRLKRDVALKVLSKSLASNADAVQRFLQEARAAAQLNHPNVVMVHDVDQQRGHCFLVMELVTGGTAQERMSLGPLSWVEATRTIADACRGLAAAHQAGLIHRDIKPSNLIRTADGIIKLADFGLAKVPDETKTSGPVTKSGAILGTPQYMSPEQCSGEPVDARSDIYSLGATYFALLTGEPPYVETQPLQIMFAHCSKPVPDPRSRRPDVPAACAEVVMTALAKQRAERFKSADEFLAALNALLANASAADLAERAAADATPTAFQGAPETLDEHQGLNAIDVSAATQPGERAGVTAPYLETRSWSGVTRLLSTTSKRRWLGVAVSAGALLIVTGWWQGWLGRGSGVGNPLPQRQQSGAPVVSPPARAPAPPITLELVAEMPGIQSAIMSVAYGKDGNTAFSGSTDGSVKEWNLNSRSVVQEFKDPTQTIREPAKQTIRAVAANNRWVAAGGDEHRVRVWYQSTGKLRAILEEPRGEIGSLAFSPDGTMLAVGGYSDLWIYDISDYQFSSGRKLGDSSSSPVGCYMVKSLAFSADSRWLAATSWDKKTVAVWNAESGELQRYQRDLPKEPHTIAFVPKTEQLVFGMHQEGLRLWDLSTVKIRSIPTSVGHEARTVAVTADGNWGLVVGPWGGLIRVHDLHGNQQSRSIKQPQEYAAMGVAISPNGLQALTWGGDEGRPRGYINLWSIVAEKSE